MGETKESPAAAAPRADLLPALARGAVALALGLALLGSYAERWGLSGAAGGTGAGGARVGDPAPAFQARTLEGGVVSLDEFRGRVAVVNFWAT